MITLYQLTTCPYCKMVRDKLDELSLPYDIVNVPMEREQRKEVFAISGQYLVPVIKDGDLVMDDEIRILPYLDDKYGKHK